LYYCEREWLGLGLELGLGYIVTVVNSSSRSSKNPNPNPNPNPNQTPTLGDDIISRMHAEIIRNRAGSYKIRWVGVRVRIRV
jgi:hypothetical protein